MQEPLCGGCRYWRPLPSDKGRGECRRHAPRLVEPPSPFEKHPLRVWPATLDSDWCGEHAAHPEP